MVYYAATDRIWKRAWQPTPIFLPGKSHGQRSLSWVTVMRWKRIRHTLELNSITTDTISYNRYNVSSPQKKRNLFDDGSPIRQVFIKFPSEDTIKAST